MTQENIVGDNPAGFNGLRVEIGMLSETMKGVANNVTQLMKDMASLTGRLDERCPAEAARVNLIATDLIACRTQVSDHCSRPGHDPVIHDITAIRISVDQSLKDINSKLAALDRRLWQFFAGLGAAVIIAFLLHMFVIK